MSTEGFKNAAKMVICTATGLCVQTPPVFVKPSANRAAYTAPFSYRR